MGYNLKKKDLKTLKPGQSNSTFEPIYEVERVDGVEKSGADYAYARLVPRGGGADTVGVITLRMPAILAPGSPLWAFCQMVGQDPAKGFDPSAAAGSRVRLTFAPVEQE